jgi:hypothetical protein
VLEDAAEHVASFVFGQAHTEHEAKDLGVGLAAARAPLSDEAMELAIIDDALERIVTQELPGRSTDGLRAGPRSGRRGCHGHRPTSNMLTPCRRRQGHRCKRGGGEELVRTSS